MAVSRECATIPDIVDCLISDPVLLIKWSQFSALLMSPPSEKQGWELGLKASQITYYELFTKLITKKLKERFGNGDLVIVSMHHYEEPPGALASLTDSFSSQNKMASNSHALHSLVKDHRSNDNYQQGIPPRIRRQTGCKISWPITFGLSKTVKNFVGRINELEALNLFFKSSENLVLVSGLGGIGKTELCRKFTNDVLHNSEGSRVSIIWLHGDTIETLRDSMLELAKKLGVTSQPIPSPSDYFEYLASFILDNSSGLLVIIDNVDNKYQEVTNVIKLVKTHEKAFIVVTSRDNTLLDSAGKTLKLGVLPKDQARCMLQQSFSDFNTTETDLLCDLLQSYPLALQQAIAYIKQQQQDVETPNYSVSDYVEEFENKKSTMLDQKLSEFEHHYELTTLVVWDMTFKKLNTVAIELLKILGYLEPDQIEISFLEIVFKNIDLSNYNRVNFKNALNIIHKYSLVKSDGKFLSIHRLVQEVIRLKILKPEYSKSLFEIALLAWVENRFEKLGKMKEHDSQQLNSICKFAYDSKLERYDKFTEVLEFLHKRNRVDIAAEYTKLYYTQIQFDSKDRKSKTELLEKIQLWSIVNGEGEVTNQMVEAGEYKVICNYSSPYLLKIALEFATMYFGSNIDMILTIKCKLAKRLHLYRESSGLCSSLCKEILDSHLDCLYNEAFNILVGVQNISYDNYESQKDILANLLESKQNRLGEIHSNTVTIKQILAPVVENLGDFEYAIELCSNIKDFAFQNHQSEKELKYHSKAMELELRLGNFHNFSRDEIYEKFSKFKDFNRLSSGELKVVLSIYKVNLGENDKLTLRVKNEISLELKKEGNWNESLPLLQEIISSNSNHVDEMELACGTLQIIAETLNQKKEYKISKKILLKVLDCRIMYLGANLRGTNYTKQHLAKALEGLGDLEGALQLQTETIEYFTLTYGGDFWRVKEINQKIVQLRSEISCSINKEFSA